MTDILRAWVGRSFRNRIFVAMLAVQLRPRSPRAKNSALWNFMATLESIGAASTMTIPEIMPPTADAVIESPRAFPAFPRWAMG